MLKKKLVKLGCCCPYSSVKEEFGEISIAIVIVDDGHQRDKSIEAGDIADHEHVARGSGCRTLVPGNADHRAVKVLDFHRKVLAEDCLLRTLYVSSCKDRVDLGETHS